MSPLSDSKINEIVRGDADGWSEYRRLILSELMRIEKEMQALNQKIDTITNGDINNLKIQVAMLNVKSGIIGAIAGMTMSGVITAIFSIMVHTTH